MSVDARPSASVVLLRPATSGWETYLLRRSGQATAYAGMWVFPGGTLRADDQLSASLSPLQAHAALTRPPGGPAATPEESLAYFVGAARELFEEAGVLLTRPRGPAENPLTPGFSPLGELRARVREGLAIGDAAAELGADLALDQLIYYAHWITPEALPRRFDTRFFLALLPDGQEATPDATEVLEGAWLDPGEALEQSEAKRLPLHFATLNHLRRLAGYPRLEDLLVFARTKPVVPTMPPTREQGGHHIPSLPPELDGVW